MLRILVPALFSLAAIAAAAAVFAIQRIEAGEGAFAQPFATRAISPNADGSGDTARVFIDATEPSTVTVRVLDRSGETVRILARRTRVDGEEELSWDGRDDAGSVVRDGEYRIELERAGDSRRYGPAQPTVVDTRPPRLEVLQVGGRGGGVIAGRVTVEPYAVVRMTTRHGKDLDDLLARQVGSASGAGAVQRLVSGQLPTGSTIRDVWIVATDRAGNATRRTTAGEPVP